MKTIKKNKSIDPIINKYMYQGVLFLFVGDANNQFPLPECLTNMVDLFVKSRPQYLQTVASSLISSAQYGHFFIDKLLMNNEVNRTFIIINKKEDRCKNYFIY
jgi:hypothetical protein